MSKRQKRAVVQAQLAQMGISIPVKAKKKRQASRQTQTGRRRR